MLPLVQRVMTTQEYLGVEKAIGKSYPVRDVPVHRRLGAARPARWRPATRCSRWRVRPTACCTPLVRRRFARAEARAFRYGDGTGTR